MPFEGYIQSENLPVKKGDEIIIPEGIPLQSTHPQFEGGRLSRQTYRVEVHHVLPGYKDRSGMGNATDKPPEVRWVGSGQYWKSANINNIQFIPEDFRKRLLEMGRKNPEGIRVTLESLSEQKLQRLINQETIEQLLGSQNPETRRIVLRYTGQTSRRARSR